MRDYDHPFADLIGLEVDSLGNGESTCSIEVRKDLLNPFKVLHGGILYSLADTGMGGAILPLLSEGEICATIEIKISYFKAVRSGKVVCRSRVVHRGKRVASLESEIHSGKERIATATGSFSIFEAEQSNK